MLTHEDNELITRVGAGTPMGNTMRRYWIPALLAWEVPEPDCPPVRVKLLGEDLVAFRDTEGRVGLLDELCPHRRASLYFGRNEEGGLRCDYQDRGIQESMGRIVDRSKEHLGPADKAIIQARRLLLEAVETVQEDGTPRGIKPTYYTLRASEGVLPRDADWREVLTPEMATAAILQTV